jgi:NADH-quinone oxidoreductase subunit G
MPVMINIEINGQAYSVDEGANVIDAAEDNGIYIPRFCYHRKLSVVANCRMCLVEIEGVGKPLPACATTVTPDMKVFTQSKKALDAQRAVMEFLLINHPLDCPVCDQGGECELQDQSVGFGNANSEFHRPKHSVVSLDIGPLIETEMTRCIHCTRCIRVSEEICGVREMGATGRGGHMEIGPYVQKAMASELSANMIDVCPVGALTSKPYAYHGRAWELHEHESIAAHDCWGSNTYVHTRGLEYAPQRDVMRVVPRENEAINENWMSNRDRFSYLALGHKERNTKVMVKRKGTWQTSEWQPALMEIADRIQAIIQGQGADQIGALMSPNSTVEEAFLLQKLMRSLGSNNIDHRVRTLDFSDQTHLPASLGLGMRIDDIEKSDCILLVGSYLRHEVPLANYRVLKAVQDEACVLAINLYDYPFNYPITHKSTVSSHQMVNQYAAVLKAVLDIKNARSKTDWVNAISPDDTAVAMAKSLCDAKNPILFLGHDAVGHSHAASLRALTHELMTHISIIPNILTHGANSAGCALAGALPHREAAAKPSPGIGLNARAMQSDPLRAYFLLNTELESDGTHPASALKLLKDAGLVVVMSPFASDEMREYADFILPIAPITETAGTFVNAAGDWQSFKPMSLPSADAKPAWKVLRVLANLLELTGFDYEHATAVKDEVKAQVDAMNFTPAGEIAPVETQQPSHLTRLGNWPMFTVDSLVRRSDALQATLEEDWLCVSVNHDTAEALDVVEGDIVVAKQAGTSISINVRIDNGLPDKMVCIPMGFFGTKGFGEAMASIELVRGDA